MEKRSLSRNEEFRRKSLRGAKVEDLLHYVRRKINEILDQPETPESRAVLAVLEDLEKYIVIKFDYRVG